MPFLKHREKVIALFRKKADKERQPSGEGRLPIFKRGILFDKPLFSGNENVKLHKHMAENSPNKDWNI